MQCFNHTDTPAVAICLSCGKALCKSCAMTSDASIVCSETCKSRLSMLRSLREKEPKQYMALSKFLFSLGLIFLLAGCLITLFQPGLLGLGIFIILVSMVNLFAAYFFKKHYGIFKTGF
ncbi:hypothetical protein KKB18_01195 [bacterium]|nr:hypothetical protein [bacterium]